MSGSVRSEIRSEPNLTPMLDVVFQLITFFMLVINFSKDQFDQRVHLPVAGSARPIEGAKANEDRITLNINSEGKMLRKDQALDAEEALKEIALQAEIVRLNAKYAGDKGKAPGEAAEGLPTTIAIRADRRAPFSPIYAIITACQRNGFHKFAWKALNAEE